MSAALFLLLIAAQAGSAPAPQAPPEPAPSSGKAAAKEEPSVSPAAEDAESSTSPRRWQLEALEVSGEAPKPAVVFIDPERERARAAMQALLAETRGSIFGPAEVSRPTEIPEGRTVVRKIAVRGALSEGQILRAIRTVLPTLASCRRAARHAIPSRIALSVELRLDEEGRVTKGYLRGTEPAAPRAGLCALGRLKRASYPPSAAGSARVTMEVVLPAPLAGEASPELARPGRRENQAGRGKRPALSGGG